MSIKKLTALFTAFCITSAIAFLAVGCNSSEEDGAGDDSTKCTHSIELIETRDATCLNEGNFEYYKCKKCGELFADAAATTTTTLERVIVAKKPHSLRHMTEETGTYTDFYYCTSCGHYFSDNLGENEIDYSEFHDSSVKPVKLTDVTLGNIFASKEANAASEAESIDEDFTFRCFMGWTNTEDKSFAEFPSNKRVQVNINLNRRGTLDGTQDWYNFGIGFSGEGLFYKDFESGGATKVSTEFNELFIQQGGIYLVVTRKGTTITLYFEDEYGFPREITKNDHYGKDSVLVRLAANEAEGAEGWTPFTTKTAVCIGIANPRCVFDAAYEN